jgi:predicted nucleotidyltransferase
MNPEVSQILEELILNLRSKNLPLEQVYLFGNHANGRGNEHSRIDAAVVLAEIDDIDETQKYFNKLRREIDFRLDIHPIAENDFNLNDPFAKEILKTGIKVL